MLPFYKKVAYGMGRFGSSFLLTLTGLTSFYIYGAKFDLNWLLAGISLATSYVVIGLAHWLTGYYSDRFQSRLGRRKPFVILGAPGLALTAFLLFVPNWFLNTTDPSIELLVFGYYLFFLCSFKFFYAFLLTAFQAWMPEITEEDERPLVSGMQNTANWIANGLGLVLGFITPLLFVLEPLPGLSTTGLIIILAFCFITILFYLPSIALIREPPDLVIPERSMIEETKTVLKNRTYVGWIMIVGFLSFSLSALTAQVVGFAQEVLRLTSLAMLLPPAMALLVSIMVFLFLWIKAVKRFGKGKTLIVSMVILAELMILIPFFADLSRRIDSVLVATILFVPLAACMAMYYLMSYIVPADIAHLDSLESGTDRAGMYEGFKGVPLNMFQAVSALLLGWFLAASVETTGSTFYGFVWWGPVFAPFLFIAAIMLFFIDIDPDFETSKGEESKPEEKVMTDEVKVEE
ncbi:MAG: MFS transporter [Candidatus Thorarchaeota archaeon]|nr:MFS transporter [Candidatus Thorarchaeota archaeon]